MMLATAKILGLCPHGGPLSEGEGTQLSWCAGPFGGWWDSPHLQWALLCPFSPSLPTSIHGTPLCWGQRRWTLSVSTAQAQTARTSLRGPAGSLPCMGYIHFTSSSPLLSGIISMCGNRGPGSRVTDPTEVTQQVCGRGWIRTHTCGL